MKISKYEESFKTIKEVTGLSDLDQIVKRFESQGETLRNLNELKDKAEEQCQKLRKQRDQLQQEFEELKYSGETEIERYFKNILTCSVQYSFKYFLN